EGVGPRSGILDQPEGGVGDQHELAQLCEVRAHQGEMVVLAHLADATDARERVAGIERAPQGIAGVGGIGDQAAPAQDVPRLADQARLRIHRMDLEIFRCRCRSGHARCYAVQRQATTTNSRPIHLVRRSRTTAPIGRGPLIWGEPRPRPAASAAMSTATPAASTRPTSISRITRSAGRSGYIRLATFETCSGQEAWMNPSWARSRSRVARVYEPDRTAASQAESSVMCQIRGAG